MPLVLSVTQFISHPSGSNPQTHAMSNKAMLTNKLLVFWNSSKFPSGIHSLLQIPLLFPLLWGSLLLLPLTEVWFLSSSLATFKRLSFFLCPLPSFRSSGAGVGVWHPFFPLLLLDESPFFYYKALILIISSNSTTDPLSLWQTSSKPGSTLPHLVKF